MQKRLRERLRAFPVARTRNNASIERNRTLVQRPGWSPVRIRLLGACYSVQQRCGAAVRLPAGNVPARFRSIDADAPALAGDGRLVVSGRVSGELEASCRGTSVVDTAVDFSQDLDRNLVACLG